VIRGVTKNISLVPPGAYKDLDEAENFIPASIGKGKYIRTKKIRDKISNSLKGKSSNEDTKRKISKALKGKNTWSKGRHPSKETREKMSVAQKGRKHSKETKEKISAWHKNKVFSEEHKANISKAQLGMKRKPHTEATRRKIGQAQIGENNHYWKGGHSTTREYRNWYSRNFNSKRRLAIRQRGGNIPIGEWEEMKRLYNHTCPCCYKNEPEIELTMDHVIPISRGGLHIIKNIQPLCQPCNSRKMTKTIRYKRQLTLGA
jgi:5-methylcytosine-specific restriction endonuclease McrA